MSVEQHRTGTYTEPFTNNQIGGFVTKADGTVHFVAAGVSERDVYLKIKNYYRKMSQHAHNNMDMSDLDRIQYKTRPVTYGLWSDNEG